MIKSMTGFGRAKYENDGREYCIEIKTINHRYNDMTIKLPRYLNFLEDKIRKYISNTIKAGVKTPALTVRHIGIWRTLND